MAAPVVPSSFQITKTNGYQSAHSDDKEPPPIRRRRPRLVGAWNALISLTYWSPLKLELNLGQIIVLSAYLAAVLVCIVKDAPLISNPNRAGFIALAQFPVVFLFATKNTILSSLLGPGNGYEKLNFMHRMAGRAMFFGWMHSWVPVDSQSSAVWTCNSWSAERDFGSGFAGPPLHHRLYVFEAS
ncbi:uncharacterized protein F5147DRAFT_819676 [Suillus discolor]|uniref:Ferric oxidoreductase domain-containing protein n=1 Tax=Suillus discolor TaxID=1912936 RepID=A0A9P7EY16_9AGAM|nr:uncharacterized protein F5147DRAFT_819676 [Suillus discolor]KAG2094851.1 hypothetical protein F5147DRAFT_819676 [Suillus discolor]